MSGDTTPRLEPDYRYVRDIAEGGFARVYLYEQIALRRAVAVKALKGSRHDPRAQQTIVDEALAMARIGNHPHIVPIVEARTSVDGQACIVMMYCAGPDLLTLVQQGELSLPRVVRLGIDIAGALQTAHQNGILHRDIKPSNILTDEYDNPRLTDFGTATVGFHVGEQVALSVPWSAPEVVAGGVGSVAADIYSLGATLYHLVTRQTPFAATTGHDSVEALTQRILTASPLPIERALPPALRELILTLLHRSPDQRPGSAARVAELLARIEQDEWGGPPPAETPWHADGRSPVRHEGLGDTLLPDTRHRGIPHERTDPPTDARPATKAPGGAVPPGPLFQTVVRGGWYNYELFISYRRGDTSGSAGRLYDALSAQFVESRIFFDTETVDGGEDFIESIDAAVAATRVMLVVIGQRWLGSRFSPRPRLRRRDDVVRREIETALSSRKRIIPVLMDGAAMPGEAALPASLKQLTRLNAIRVDHDRFHHDVARLMESIRQSWTVR